jgi:hypothetical protein
MRFIAFLILAVAVSTTLFGAESPPAGWKEHSAKDKSYTVWMPEKGKSNDVEQSVHLSGTIMKVKVARLEQEGGLSYTASVLILPLKYRKINSAELLESIKDGYIKDSKAKISSEKEVKQGNLPGKEYVFESDTKFTRLRMFVSDGSIYRAEMAGTKEQVESADAGTFMDSFKLPTRATIKKK